MHELLCKITLLLLLLLMVKEVQEGLIQLPLCNNSSYFIQHVYFIPYKLSVIFSADAFFI